MNPRRRLPGGDHRSEGRVPVGTVFVRVFDGTLELRIEHPNLHELLGDGDAEQTQPQEQADASGTPMDKLLLKPNEAADVLGISRTKVYELLAVGAIRSVQIGACRRIPRRALHDFVEQLGEA